ncbi:MAG: hypothetical protein DRQ47_08740, partial [Gammaproteobacteria bacterium]
MEASILHWLELLLLPPGINLFLLFFALLFLRRLPTLALFINATSILLLLVLSMPLAARYLLMNLQQYPAIQMTEVNKESPT